MKMDEDRRNHLVKESSHNYPGLQAITSPHHVVSIMRDAFDIGNLSEEYVHMIALSTANTVKGIFEISHGKLESAPIHPREVFSRALLAGAAGIILTHNHPSGEVKPSPHDIKETDRLYEAGLIMGITLYDHIIITDAKHYSMGEAGLMPWSKKEKEMIS